MGIKCKWERQVKTYTDGEYKGNIEIGEERLDVNEVYPGYIGEENNGY